MIVSAPDIGLANGIGRLDKGRMTNKADIRDRPEFMTLVELASYLSVSERTIYDWAQRGKVPAYKLGAAWRFRKDEIDRWLTSRRSGPALDPQTERCSVCSREMTSDRPIAGHCTHTECERPICGSCWGILRRRNCSAHLPGDQPDAGGEARSRIFKGEPGRGQHSAASLSVLSARFLDGFSKRVERRPYLAGADGMSIDRVDSWKWIRSAGAGEPSAKTLRPGKRTARTGRRLESGDWVAYTIPLQERVLRTANDTLRFEARVVRVTRRRIRRTEEASKPITRNQLDQALNSALAFAEDESLHYVVGLYAPQGWAEDAHDLLNSPASGQRFLHPDLSVALIGADPEQVVWNDNDPVIAELGNYYHPIAEDEVAKCAAYIRELLGVSGVYLVSNVIEEEGFASNVALEAIEALVSTNEIEVVTEQGEKAIVRLERSKR